jgi:hypothetical protein
LIYTGGLAYHPVNSTFILSGVTGTPSSTYYAYGESSQSVGRVISWTSATSSLVVENLYGIFEEGETLAFQTVPGDVDSNADGISGSISSISQQSLAEAYPDLERAIEIETRYMLTHAHDFENISSGATPTTRRATGQQYIFHPETLAILDRYRRYYL